MHIEGAATMRKWVLVAGILVVGGATAFAARLQLPTLIEIGPGYSADLTCACVFVSGRTPESCIGDLDPLARRLVSVSVEPASRSVSARALGLVHRTARYRDGYGCTLED
jgi:hypothetical protein